MDAPLDDSGPFGWLGLDYPPWDDNMTDFDPRIMDSEDTTSTKLTLPGSVPIENILEGSSTNHLPLTDFPFQTFSGDPLDYIENIDALGLDFSPLTESTSPSISSDALWSPLSGDFVFTCSLQWSDMPRMFPDMPPSQSPYDLISTPPENFDIDTSHFSANLNVTYVEEVMASPQQSITISGVQMPPPPPPPQVAATTNQAHPLQGKPPDVSARKWRKQKRPETCPICGKGHPNRRDKEEHIRANHKDRAAEFGVSLEPHICPHCSKKYARDCGLTRHLTNKHGRIKGTRKKRTDSRKGGRVYP